MGRPLFDRRSCQPDWLLGVDVRQNPHTARAPAFPLRRRQIDLLQNQIIRWVEAQQKGTP